MKCLNMFDEYGKGMNLPSMRKFFEPETYEGQDKIVHYLKKHKKTFARTELARDFFTGERISVEVCGMTDGEYSWSSTLAYYVEKYNLRLPKEFEEKVFAEENEIL